MKYDTNNKVLKALNLWEPLKNAWTLMDRLTEGSVETSKKAVYEKMLDTLKNKHDKY